MLGIFIKTTGYHQPVPRNYICMPEFPTMVGQFIFCCMGSILIFFIPAVFVCFRNKFVGVIFKIIHLCCLETYFIYADLPGQSFNIFYLVFIWFYYQELEENKRRFAVQFFFPSYNIPCTFKYFFQVAANAVLLVTSWVVPSIEMISRSKPLSIVLRAASSVK